MFYVIIKRIGYSAEWRVVMRQVRHSITLSISLILIALLFTACAKSYKTDSLVGDWECLSEASILGEGVGDAPQVSLVSTEVSFYEDGTGLWQTSFDNELPSVSRSFTYTVDDGSVTLDFEDGKTEVFGISLSNGVLELNSNRTQWTLSRKN